MDVDALRWLQAFHEKNDKATADFAEQMAYKARGYRDALAAAVAWWDEHGGADFRTDPAWYHQAKELLR